MANLSYCRFQNTLRDLRECIGQLEDEGVEEMSDEELRAAERMMREAKEELLFHRDDVLEEATARFGSYEDRQKKFLRKYLRKPKKRTAKRSAKV